MISKRSLFCIQFLSKIGNTLKISFFKLSTSGTKIRLQNVKESLYYRISLISASLIVLIFLQYVFLQITWYKSSYTRSTLIFGAILELLCILAFGTDIYLHLNAHNYIFLYNNLLKITESQTQEMYQDKHELKRVVEAVVIITTLGGLGVIGILVPTFFTLIHFAEYLNSIFQPVSSKLFVINLGISLIIAYGLGHAAYNLTLSGVLTTLLINGLVSWIRFLECNESDPTYGRYKAQTVRKYFRTYQVLDVLRQEVYSILHLIVFYVGLGVQIIGYYAIIRFHIKLYLPVFLMILITSVEVGIQCAYLFQKCVDLKVQSETLIHSYLRIRLRKSYRTLFWKSCRPLEVHVGTQFSISSRNFCLTVYFAVIFKTVADLLISYK